MARFSPYRIKHRKKSRPGRSVGLGDEVEAEVIDERGSIAGGSEAEDQGVMSGDFEASFFEMKMRPAERRGSSSAGRDELFRE